MRMLSMVGLAALGLSLMAVDFPALPDGGSKVTPGITLVALTDGGTQDAGVLAYVTVDTGHVTDWVMTIRCSTGLACATPSPRSYYRLSADGGTATTNYQLLEVDRTFDIPVSQGNTEKLRFLSLLGEDGGPPCCFVQQPTIP